MTPPTPITSVGLYVRALGMLRTERALTALLTFAGIFIAVVQLAEPILFGRVVDALYTGQKAFPLIGLWAALGFFGIIAGVIVAVSADRLAHRQRLAAIGTAFERAITMPISYHAEKGSGAVVRSILSGTDALFWSWLGFMREQLTAIVGIAILIPTAISMDLRMALLLMALAAAYVVMSLTVINKTTGGQAEVERYHNEVYGRVGDVLGNVTVVQSFSRLSAEVTAMRSVMSDLLDAQYPVLTWWGVLTMLTRAAATVTMIAVFSVGAVLVERGEVTVGQIVSFVAFASLLIGKLDQVSGFVVRIFQQAPTLASYFALIDATTPIVEKPGAEMLKVEKGRVAYQAVTFKYGDSTQGVFDLELAVEPGQTVAFVGPTGSGKTTTLALLQRMRDPEVGTVSIDGRDIRDFTLASLRHAIAVVFQDAGLFNRSIADNIRIGKSDASDADVERAARLAEAHEFILKKPGGYQFVIGERGASLSGGERQRLAIARAILKDAPILVLDEATSALDAETEARIKRALDTLRQGRTTFIIAHRLSTVANADVIFVLDHGRVVEQGSFRDLVAMKGLFSRMVAEGGFTEPTATDEDEVDATHLAVAAVP